MRQLGTAWLSYAQDYDESLPIQYWNSNYWALIVAPYLKNTQILLCPSDRTFNATTGVGYYGGNAYGLQYSPLGVAASTNNGGAALGGISSPSSVFMVGDDEGNTSGIVYPYEDLIARNGYAIPSKRHNEGGNWAYVDGHAKWQKQTSMAYTASGGSASWNF